METAKLNRTIRFKFGKALRKGTLVEIAETKENTSLVRIPKTPTLEYLVNNDALSVISITEKKFNSASKVLETKITKIQRGRDGAIIKVGMVTKSGKVTAIVKGKNWVGGMAIETRKGLFTAVPCVVL